MSDAGGGKVLSSLKIGGRIMVMLSRKDEVVPKRIGMDLVTAAGTGVEGRERLAKVLEVKGALHENARQYRTWTKELVQFVQKSRLGH